MLDTESDDTASAHIGQIQESANYLIVESIIDYCFESNTEPANCKNFEVNLKFPALVNMTNFAVDSHHKDLLKHPVMLIFVNLMWQKLK